MVTLSHYFGPFWSLTAYKLFYRIKKNTIRKVVNVIFLNLYSSLCIKFSLVRTGRAITTLISKQHIFLKLFTNKISELRQIWKIVSE